MSTTYPIHNIASAPEKSRQSLTELQQAFGMLPNIAGALAESPVLINGLWGLFQQVHGGNFSEADIQVLLLTNAVTNRCAWAVAFHSFLARQQGIAAADVDAVRGRGLPADPRAAALSTLARTLIEQRGQLGDADRAAFIAAGFGRDAILEVVAVVAASTITNYGANVAQPPLEEMFQAYAWQP